MKYIFYLFCFVSYTNSVISQCEDIPSDYTNDACGDNPNVNFTASGVATFCENQEVTFVNETAGDVNYYDHFIIDWGDGTPCQYVYDYNPVTHIFNFDGIDKCEEGPKFDAEMRFIGIKECTEGITSAGGPRPYEVRLSPVAKIQSNQVFCLEENINIFNNSCNEDSILWEFGNGMISMMDTPNSISYSSPGTYNITLTVYNTCGEDQTVETITVVDYPQATIYAETDEGMGCNPSRQIISITGNEWALSQPSRYFNWSISPSYSNVNGPWCFTNDIQQQNPCPQDPSNNFCPCIPDSLLSSQIIDSLLRLPTLDIWFKESGEYPIQLDYGNACADSTSFETIYIYEQPSIDNFQNISGCDSLTLCYSDLDINFTGDIELYMWSFTGGSISDFIGSNPDFGCVEFSGNGSVSLTIKAFDPCNDVTEVVNVSIITTSAVSVDDPSPDGICQNSGGIYLAPNPSGGCYYYNGDKVDDFISGDTLYPEFLSGGNYNIQYILNADCEAEDMFNFTIIEAPFIQLGNIIPECENITDYNPQINSSGGDIDQYIWQLCDSNGDAVLTSNDPNPSFDWGISGNYSIKVEVLSDECGSVLDTASLFIQPDDPALIDPFENPYCQSSGLVTLTASPPGGSWSGTGIIDEDLGIFDPTLVTNVFSDITYSFSGGACTSSDTQTIEVYSENITVSSSVSFCYYSGTYTLTGFSPTNGTWSGIGIIDEDLGIIDLSLLSQNNEYTYTYCVESQTIECLTCDSTTLVLYPDPTAAFSLDGSPCSGNEFILINESTNADNYMWDFGDTMTSTLPNPKHTYSSNGTYTIQLITFTDMGCSDTTSQDIYVTAPPTIDVDIITDEGCAPLNVSYINNSFGENAIQYWIIGGIDTLFGANPEIILDGVSTDSLISVEFVVFNDCDTLRESKNITVHPTPIVDFGITDDEGCSPDTVWFVNATIGLPDSFYWNFGNLTTDTIQDPGPQVYTSPGDSISMYTISLIAENMCGSDTLSKEIIVYPNNIDAFFEIDTLSGCPPLAVSITSYATPGAIVTYDFGDMNTGDIADTTYIFTTPGEYIITQYAAQCGIDSFKSDTITVFPLADIDFSLPSYACIGDTVSFINESQGGTLSQWNFGDESTSTENNTFHVYDSVGNFNVSLIVNSSLYNCPDTLTQSILIPEPPIAEFTIDPIESCPDELITFTSTSQGVENFEWDFGNGPEGYTEIITRTFSTPGTYEVKLTVYDSLGCSTDTTVINFLVHPDPIANMGLSADVICQFHDTIFVEDLSVGGVGNKWFLDGICYDSNASELVLISDIAGASNLKLITTNSFGCSDSITKHFTVLESPTAIPSVLDTSGCEDFVLIIDDLSTNSNLTIWIFDEGNTSSDSSVEHIFLDAGDYENLLIAGNTNDCPNDTAIIKVDVSPRSIAKFDIEAFDSCGIPATIIFDNGSTLSTDYTWTFGDGDTSSLFNPTHEYESDGDFKITLIATNEFDCSDTTVQSIELFPQPIASFDLPSLDYCEGDTINILNSSVNSTHFTFSINDENESENFPISLSESGVYELTIIAHYEEVCFDTFPIFQNITIHDSPTAGFISISDSESGILGGVQFDISALDFDEVIYDFGDGATSNEENPFHEYDHNGPQTVCQFVYNLNNGQKTCEDKATQIITYKDIDKFFVPNAMSPDRNFGDEEVGLFKPKGVGILRYELNVFSPWGDHIKTLNKVIDGEPVDAWDGTYEGTPVPMGAYPWKAVVYYDENNAQGFTGTVTVIR